MVAGALLKPYSTFDLVVGCATGCLMHMWTAVMVPAALNAAEKCGKQACPSSLVGPTAAGMIISVIALRSCGSARLLDGASPFVIFSTTMLLGNLAFLWGDSNMWTP